VDATAWRLATLKGDMQWYELAGAKQVAEKRIIGEAKLAGAKAQLLPLAFWPG
jgi:hypothetical protein